MLRNDEVIKFLLTETEISKYPHLKAKMLPVFFNIDNEAELNEEIIELLSIENEQAYKQELIDLLYTPHISNEYLIKSFRNISDINKPLTITVSYDNGQTFHNEERSLLMRAIQSNRMKLAEELINRGAKLLPNEIQDVLWNNKVPDEIFIKSLKDVPDINKPLIINVSYDNGQTFHDKECSLLIRSIESNRIELAKELVNMGAKLLPNEIQNALWNNKVPDEIFIRSLKDVPDINKPLIITVSYDNGQIFHDEERSLLMKAIDSNRIELAKELVNMGAKLLPNEIQNALRNNKVPDEIFIRSFEDIPNINKPLTINVRYDNGQTFHNEECSLLESAISSNRLGLSKYLVDRGADVNLKSSIQIPIYVTAFHKSIESFEILVARGRLLKEQNMDYYTANLDNQISLNLSNLYDVIAWRDKFKADLNNDILKYKNWFNNGNIHSIKNLCKTFQKFSNIEINYVSDDHNVRQAQDTYHKQLIEQYLEINNVISEIEKHFSNHWSEAMLICKNFDSNSIFNTQELKRHIGEYLFDILLSGELMPQEPSV
ncbi:hypothetical protein H6P87_00729 [Rickettsia tillamookensis]|uniref:Ankyrin repeat protein n=1 Tax=Rickettsia tillamookensis TaxID=2761623 RepID=A0A9E6MHM1_9RICK|nr:hypothetical protein [Rickettsia tillamookensis]QQV75183.1 hypothetical protein H6P87_00729 [Rickettsia tillamookensis]